MSYIYSQALVAEYSAANCLDTDAFALLNESHTLKPSWWHDKTMEPSRHSRFGMTYAPLTESLGAELLMWWQADSLAKTSALQEAGPDWTAKGQGYGEKWSGLLAKYSPDTHSLKTAQLSLLEDLNWCCATLPRWGLMLGGELYPQPMLEPFTAEKDCGFWPTPTCDSATDRSSRYAQGGMPLTMAVKLWPTPQASDNRDRGNSSTPAIKRRIEKGKQVMLSMCVSSENGRLNPDWTEWLMGWPIGQTDLKPLEMDRFREWQQQHSPCSPADREAA